MEYRFREIEKRWQEHWKQSGIYKVKNPTDKGFIAKPKCYVLDMFPYPSGSGLHVGHPLGYIATDIYSRFKRLKGFNVLHPMGYDAFGLPAEQYAIDHGIHPAVSTEANVQNFRGQLENIGFSFDWDREVRTSDPKYYKWTQWIFLQLFDCWFNKKTKKAERIPGLEEIFKAEGNNNHPFPNDKFVIEGTGNRTFSSKDWNGFDETARQAILMEYRLAYCGYGEVNWCEALGTVLANDEVVNGVSERGGFPVERRRLRQWYLRITDYADRLLEGLEKVDFSEAMKEMQRNWIGKSSGAEIDFQIKNNNGKLRVYTTRPDTIFGVDFMVIAPEHDLVSELTSPGQKKDVEEYIAYVKSRSERERIAEKKISGVFTGAYALNPFNKKEIPIWISEYVLAGYGTGAIMAVPSGDERDHKFAKQFSIDITNIIGAEYNGEEANPTKDAILHNSDFLNGVKMSQAINIVIEKLEELGIGTRKVNYKMRDAAFSRQRYWGEPFPITWENGIAKPLNESELPLELPKVETYQPGPNGEGPLANIPEWTSRKLETNTMPGYAGSSWYFLRYMDPHNDAEFCDKKIAEYWNQVDLYVGGTEHAVGHLLYSRMWTKALFDLGYISHDEPFKKLINQGMIQGSSRFVYRIHGTNQFVSYGLMGNHVTDQIHVDVNMVDGIELDISAFRQWRNSEFADAEFILEDGKYLCGVEVEKMSKTKYNTVNPDELVLKYGADTFRMYEMFLGPIEMSKPWDTKGIEGVHRFLKKLWRLFFDDVKGKVWSEETPTNEELKVLHRTIRKIEDDSERFSFNTGVSGFMIAVNELGDLNCHKKEILSPLLILLAPYAPHITEELWHQFGNEGSILDAEYPKFESKYVMETSKDYPISVNGKLRTTLNISLEATPAEVESMVIQNEIIKKWLDGKPPKKIIFIKGKMVNVVI
jgi:leucyl-tRNA synthetase